MKRNQIIQVLTLVFAMLAAATSLAGCARMAERPQESAIAAVQLLFKLDPRLLGPTYGGERWVSPPTYGPILHPGSTYVVEARAVALNQEGERLPAATFEWIPEDPEMVAVSPGQGEAVSIKVQGAGESRLQVTSRGASKILTIRAAYRQNNVIEVEITQ